MPQHINFYNEVKNEIINSEEWAKTKESKDVRKKSWKQKYYKPKK